MACSKFLIDWLIDWLVKWQWVGCSKEQCEYGNWKITHQAVLRAIARVSSCFYGSHSRRVTHFTTGRAQRETTFLSPTRRSDQQTYTTLTTSCHRILLNVLPGFRWVNLLLAARNHIAILNRTSLIPTTSHVSVHLSNRWPNRQFFRVGYTLGDFSGYVLRHFNKNNISNSVIFVVHIVRQDLLYTRVIKMESDN